MLKVLGPGLITGASDDDPSGIATYTQAGARFGPKLLWTAIVTYPLMVAVQEMCARIGLVTGKGLTGVIRDHYPKPVLYLILLVSIPSIIFNIGADLAGMGAVMNLLLPSVPDMVFSVGFTILMSVCIVFWPYYRIASVLKWLCLTLFAYIIIPFLMRTDWYEVLLSTFIPTWENSREFYMALVGILGTTISPYLFFWQTSSEVEETNMRHLMVDKKAMTEMQMDVRGGLLITNLVFYFIILASSTALFQGGVQNIQTVEQAAAALKPIAGDLAYLLFALGIVGTGLLAIPVLAGALSYMVSEFMGWTEGLNKKWHEAPGFYGVILLGMVTGLGLQFFGISPVQALIWSAVLYGISAPVIIFIILRISANQNIMGQYVHSRFVGISGWTAFFLMAISAILLIIFLIIGN